MSRKIRFHAEFGTIHPQRRRKVRQFLFRTIGYGEIIGIKPAKTLLQEQKEHLMGDKKEGEKHEEKKKVE